MGQILNIGRSMPQARREKPSQPLPVLPLYVRYERLFVAQRQAVSPVTRAYLSYRASRAEK